MTIINIIIIFLLLTPIYGVITDIKTGKIKNYFIFPVLIISIFLSFLIEGFYQNFSNIIAIIIILFFGYLFYKNNKWGAGDGKYIILIGFNSIIISHLLGIGANILNILFIIIFGILLIYNFSYILINIKKIIKKYKKENKKNFSIKKLINNIFLSSSIYLFAILITKYIGGEYLYMIIFLFIILLTPYINYIKNIFIRYFIIILSIITTIYNNDYFSYLIILAIFLIFNYLQLFFNKIFEIIDKKEINILEIKSGDILSEKSIEKIKKDVNIELLQTPLQGNEIFEIILRYKKLINKKKETNLSPKISIYKEFKIGIIMYIGYLITILYIINK